MSCRPYALAGLLLAAPAAAEVTPRELWDDWLSQLEAGDAEVSTGAVEETDGRVVVRKLSIRAGDEGRYSLDIDEIAMSANDDGSVAVAVSPEYPIVLTDTESDGTVTETRLRVRHPDLSMQVDEDGGVRTHAFQAPRIEVDIEEVRENGEVQDVEGGALVTAVDGRYDVGDDADGASAFTADLLEISIAGADPDDGGTLDLSVEVEDLSARNILQVFGGDTGAAARALADGESRQASYRAEVGRGRIEVRAADGETSVVEMDMGPSETDIELTADALRYDGRAEAATVTLAGDALPLPEVRVDVGSSTAGLSMPVLGDTAAQPFAYDLSLREVAVDDGLWNMLDPAGILPRDPGEVVFDATGTAIVEDDIGAARGIDIVSELKTLTLKELRFAMVDAEVAASGDLEITDGPAGTAQPVGEIEVVLTGANTLIERLVQVGVLPQDQAMGVQMMLGIFARPGTGPNELRSTVRMTQGGQVFVNDQQVR